MKILFTDYLKKIVESLDKYEDSFVVFSETPWKSDSRSNVCSITDSDDYRLLVIDGMDYFLEVNIMKEVIGVWKDWYQNESPTIEERVRAIIFYAENDAFYPPPSLVSHK